MQSESGLTARLGIHVRSNATTSPTGLSPAQIRKAYNLPSYGGNGTIAIIDAFDDPTVLSDYINFSSQFGLPTTNFEEHKMAPTINVDGGWALEISLDVQWAHAIAPNAHILLVEAVDNNLGNLLLAVNYATNRSDVAAISMSWGSTEFSTESSYDSNFASSYGAVFFASAGDSAGVLWPASSPNVIAVGGTSLTLNSNGSVAKETVWNDQYGTTGGGVSAYETEPYYQVTYGISGSNGKRGVPDVSYDADPASGVSVYDTTAYNSQSGWFQVGGTSAGAPQWAAIHSLGLSCSNSNFYQDTKSQAHALYFGDITNGSNGAFSAGSGYDYVTGLGSPVTTNFSPLGGAGAKGPILINTKQGLSANILMSAGGSVNLYFGQAFFSGGQFSLYTSRDGSSQRSAGDTSYTPTFQVSDLANMTASSTYSQGDMAWTVGFNWVNGSISTSLGTGAYYIKAFAGSNSSVAVTDTYLTVEPANAYLVVRGQDNAIYFRTYTATTATWTGWSNLPTGTTTDAPATTFCSGKLYFVVRGSDGSSLWFSSTNLTDSTFSGWTLLSGSTPSAPTLTSNGTSLALVVRGGDNRIYYRFYTIASQIWTGWSALSSGSTLDSPAASLVANALHIVVKGSEGNTLWYGYLNVTTNSFSGWTLLSGSTPSIPTLTSDSTALSLVVRGQDNRIYYRTYTLATKTWTGWNEPPSGTTPQSPAATILQNNLFILAVGLNGSNLWQTTINLATNAFSGWALLSGLTPSKPTLTS